MNAATVGVIGVVLVHDLPDAGGGQRVAPDLAEIARRGAGGDRQLFAHHHFYRSRSARADGSGIGLAFHAELTTGHGGTLTADSSDGQGATFTTRLPASSREPTG